MERGPRDDLRAIFEAALDAVDPEKAVLRHVQRNGSLLKIDGVALDLDDFDRIVVLGAGKGTAPMALALEELLADRITEGVIVVKYGHGLELGKTRIVEAGHPVPDQAGLQGAKLVLDAARRAGKGDLVLTALSGGGSALMPAPTPPATLDDKQATTRSLLSCGASIQEINAVRKHLSKIKGGGLARAASPARQITLILSDVIGDPLDTIASGPTAPDPTTYQQCLEIVKRYDLWQTLPPSIVGILSDGAHGKRPETPKPGDPIFDGVRNVIVGNNLAALEAAEKKASSLGYRTLIFTSRLEGEAREVAKAVAAVAKEVVSTGHPVPAPACLLFGGETTVTIRGRGKGGRNQELALAAALALDGWNRIHLLSAGTDGTDGPTDAAGAFVDGNTVERARNGGMDLRSFLENNNAYTLFKHLGDLLITGPTRTNVMDLLCVVIR